MRVHLLYKAGEAGIDATIAELQSNGTTVVPVPSRHPEEIPGLLAAGGIDRIVVSGGDGMIHHAAQQLTGSGIPLAIIPAGTGNDIARALKIPKGRRAAVRLARTEPTPLDVLEVTENGPDGRSAHVVSVLTAGFSGLVNAHANRMRWSRGRLKYTVATIRNLPKLRTYHQSGLEGYPAAFSLLAFANTRYFGGGIAICPKASPTDAMMDVIVVAQVHPAHLAAVLPAAFVGLHLRDPRVHVGHAGSVSIEIDTDWWADGEPLELSGPVKVSVVPGGLHVPTGL
jgi:diacylglycerol kinase (ATP)